MESAEYYLEHKQEAYELIKDLAQSIQEYQTYFEIIDNPNLKYYDENDETYLRFPYAVKFYVDYSELYLGKRYEEILYINEGLDGLDFWHEDYNIPVDSDSWLFIGAYHRAIDKIKYQEIEIQKLKAELENV